MKAEEALSFDSEHRLRSENLSFDIDTWFPKLKQFTFDSLFIPLKRCEAESIIAFHDVSWRNYQQRPYLTREEVQILKDLEETLDTEIQQLCEKHGQSTSDEKGVFLRLCGRSPKDGEPYNRQLPMQLFEKELQNLLDAGFPATANTEMIAIAKSKFLKVASGKDAMSLLLTSERVYAEMIDWLKFGEPEQICLRIWEKELSLDYEFRVFIYKGRMTAITQYDHYTHFPYLFPQKEFFQKGLYDYWKTIHPHVSEMDSSYIIDIAYLPVSQRFTLIELSPFSPCTGPALFHWKFNKDILEGTYLSKQSGGEEEDNWKEIIFRLKEEKDIHPDLKDLIEINWKHNWRQEKRPFDSYYETTVEDMAEQAQIQSEETENNIFRKMSNSVSGFFSQLRSTSVPSNPSDEKRKLAADNTVVQEKNEEEQVSPSSTLHYLFVYGTLKSGFHWNTKYLHPRLGAKYLSKARTVDSFALVLGDSGVPYLLGDIHSSSENRNPLHQIVGELWEVDEGCLKGLDEYEGISKEYYSRILIPVDILPDESSSSSLGQNKEGIKANVYTLNHSDEELRNREFLSEYTMELHQRCYKPIKHIQVKQFNYFKTPSNWGKTDELMDGMTVKPNH
jgi:gamma-glutamylcyclotransferase (GGCT)/AIG2-like uncharacterized protein YtfP